MRRDPLPEFTDHDRRMAKLYAKLPTDGRPIGKKLMKRFESFTPSGIAPTTGPSRNGSVDTGPGSSPGTPLPPAGRSSTGSSSCSPTAKRPSRGDRCHHPAPADR
jgi:hypothetical protein